MTDLVDVKLLMLRELTEALEEERDEKIVRWEIESTPVGLTFHTLHFSLDGERMARVDSLAEEAGVWTKDPIEQRKQQ